jgi:hypothetical protein
MILSVYINSTKIGSSNTSAVFDAGVGDSASNFACRVSEQESSASQLGFPFLDFIELLRCRPFIHRVSCRRPHYGHGASGLHRRYAVK